MSWFSNVVKQVTKPETFASFIPGIAGGALSLIGSERRNRREASNARAQMDFQRQMSSTGHQRQMRDLYAAGLNPILSGKLGGAPSGSGAMSKPENSFEKAIASASAVAQVQNLQANIKKAESETRLKDAQAVIEEQKGGEDYGTYVTNQVKKEITRLDRATDLINSQHEGQKLKNTYDQWANNWYRNVFKAPQAALTARFENFLFSTGLAGVSKKQIDAYQKNIGKAFDYVNNHFAEVVNDPKKLNKIFGTIITGFIIKTLSESAANMIKALWNMKKSKKSKSFTPKGKKQ